MHLSSYHLCDSCICICGAHNWAITALESVMPCRMQHTVKVFCLNCYLIIRTISPKTSGTLLLSLPSKANSRHSSSQNISAKQHCPSPLSVCMCVCVYTCVHFLHSYAWALVEVCIMFLCVFFSLFFLITFSISVYIMCVILCLDSALSRWVGTS